jgi:transcription elongation factor Elf1
MTRDANAPFELGPDDWADFDKRTDVCTLQCAIAKAKEHGELDHRETLRSRLKYLRSTWGTLKRADNRRRYFEEADRARSQGQQPPRRVKHTTNHAEAVRSCRSGAQMANQVLLYFDRCWNDRSDEMSGRYLHLLVVYLMGGSKARLDTWEEEEEANKDELMQEEQDINYDEHSEEDNVGNRDSKSNELHTTNISMDDGYFECVLCDLRYSSRTTLTGHYDKHVKKKFFEKPLQCPICRQQQQQQREKMNVWVGEGFPAWLNHLEQCHGKRYTPYFRQDTSQAAKYPCPFANCVTQRKDKIFNSRGLSNHVFRSHAKEHTKDQFKTPIICRYCTLPGDNNSSTTILKNIWDWKQHFTLVHEEQQQRTMFECYICSQLVRTAGGLKSHFSNLHERKEGFFERPFTCPECVKLGKTNCATMSSRKAWQDHIDQYHDGGAKRPQLAEFRPPEYRCLVCLQQYSTRENLSHHLKLAHTELFTVPFQCPACVRQGKQDTEIFDSQVAWTYHTWRYHRDVILSSTSDVDSPESSKIGMSECEDLACVSLEGRNSQLPNISTTPEDELTWSGVVNIVPDVVSGTDKLDGLQNTPLRRMRGSCKRKRDSLKEDQAESRNKRCGRVSAVTIPIDPALLD